LLGRLQARTPAQLDRLRSGLSAVLDRDLSGQQQPLTLLYQRYDGDRAVSDAGRVQAVYTSGLEGAADNLLAESVPISFTAFLPVVQSDAEQGVTLSVQQSLTAPSAMVRGASGAWSVPSGFAIATIPLAFTVGLDRTVYAGTSGGSRFFQLASGAWSAVAGGANAAVRAFAVDSNGDIYFVGDFTSVGTGGGTVAASRIARYRPSTGTFAALGTGLGALGRSLAIDPVNRKLYVVGDFVTAGGLAAPYVAQWDLATSAWSAVGAGLGAPGFGVVYGKDRKIYALSFGDSATRPVRLWSWDGSSLTTVAESGSVTDDARALTVTDDGLIVGGGLFSTMDGVTVNNLFAYDGANVKALSTGTNAIVRRLTTLPNGRIVVAGDFTQIGSLTTSDGIAVWLGGAASTFIPVDADFPSGSIQAIAGTPDGALYVGYNAAGSAALSAAQTTVTNAGTVKSYPVLSIKGPTSGSARIAQITNDTTGRVIFLDLVVSAGETVTMQFEPSNLVFVSDFQGSIANKILPGSHEADFYLRPGANLISFFSADSTVRAILHWRPNFATIADLTV
jgi:hypothetical protein